MRIYIHIPFCLRKCAYCDFLSFSSDEDTRAQYLFALKAEIRARFAEKDANGRRIASVFFGGGTPTVLSGEELAGILDAVRRCAVLEEDAEITTEANPCTVDTEKLSVLKDAGFNRISIGAQSTDDRDLKLLGRLHDRAGFEKALDAARKAGFANINLDMISGLPDRTAEDWEKEIRRAAEYGTEHISAYSLELYEGTPLFREKDRYRWPSDDELARMYECTAEILAEYGLQRYELSNYAKPGRECRHNTGYWTGDEYMGFGIGAASYEEGTRFVNTPDLRAYLENASGPEAVREDVQRLDKKDLETEFMILGLRLTRGVSRAEFRARFGEGMEEVFGDVIGKYAGTGHLIEEGDRLRLSEKALFVSNAVLSDFL